MGAERDLAVLLRSMAPVLRPGSWVMVTLSELPAGSHPLATFAEEEGLSVVLPLEEAEAAGCDYDLLMAWITLTVHSALDAVGLTAAVAGCLADSDIPCNVVAARHHDHLLVPFADRHHAMALLRGLSAG